MRDKEFDIYLLACVHQRIDDHLARGGHKVSENRLLGYDQYEDYLRMGIDWIKDFEIRSAEERLGLDFVQDFDQF